MKIEIMKKTQIGFGAIFLFSGWNINKFGQLPFNSNLSIYSFSLCKVKYNFQEGSFQLDSFFVI